VGDGALGKPALLHELELHQLLRLREDRKSAPQDQGVDEEPVVIDDVELDESSSAVSNSHFCGPFGFESAQKPSIEIDIFNISFLTNSSDRDPGQVCKRRSSYFEQAACPKRSHRIKAPRAS
jgi:hypothetical protein